MLDMITTPLGFSSFHAIASGAMAPWKFECDGEVVRVDPSGPLLVQVGAATDLAVDKERIQPSAGRLDLQKCKSLGGFSYAYPYAQTRCSRHIDEGIQAEDVDLPTQQIGDTRLSDT
jgi:hypothetical protein